MSADLSDHPELACPNGCHPRYLKYSTYADVEPPQAMVRARHQGSTTRWWMVLTCGECGETEIYLSNISSEAKRALDNNLLHASNEIQDMATELEKEGDVDMQELMEEAG